MSIVGVVSEGARGHVVTTILIGMGAMLLTAISCGRMARAYPSAGSAFTYVARTMHPGLGFVTGWGMVMDYVLNPTICTILCSKIVMNVVPEMPCAAWVIAFATLMRPFYDPATSSWAGVFTGTSIACLTDIGFDGISTLSEEAKNPARDILRATVLTCLITGVLAAHLVYTAQLVRGNWTGFPDVDTAFVHVAGRAGGAWIALGVVYGAVRTRGFRRDLMTVG